MSGKFGSQVDGLSEDLRGTGRALDAHADDVDTVTARVDLAAGVAREGGLAVTETQIADPGPPPPPAQPLPTDRPPTAQQQQAHEVATQSMSAYVAKVAAYQEAGRIVSEARGIELASQRKLLDFLESQAKKSPLTIGDLSTGLAGTVAARTSKFRADATRMADKAARAGRLMSPETLRQNYSSYIKAAVIEANTPAVDRDHLNCACWRR